MDIFLQNLDENWLDDIGKACVPVQPKVYGNNILIKSESQFTGIVVSLSRLRYSRTKTHRLR